MDRFWEKVDRGDPDECWEWKAATDNNGYGRFWFDGENRPSHQVSWEISYGDRNGEHILHTCDNKICVNPNHLYLGTPHDNLVDAYERGQKDPVMLRGEDNPRSKLTREEVQDIREKYARGESTYEQLAEEYDTVYQNIGHIVNVESWQ